MDCAYNILKPHLDRKFVLPLVRQNKTAKLSLIVYNGLLTENIKKLKTIDERMEIVWNINV